MARKQEKLDTELEESLAARFISRRARPIKRVKSKAKSTQDALLRRLPGGWTQ